MDEQIAAKEAYLENLKAEVEAKNRIVEAQKEILERYQKSLKERGN